jgi:hypothetical protein
MRQNAQVAADILIRVGGDGGVLRQIAGGEWDGRFTDEQTHDVAERIEVMSELVRHTRGKAPHASRPDWSGHADRLRLPTNRKERYYTGGSGGAGQDVTYPCSRPFRRLGTFSDHGVVGRVHSPDCSIETWLRS